MYSTIVYQFSELAAIAHHRGHRRLMEIFDMAYAIGHYAMPKEIQRHGMRQTVLDILQLIVRTAMNI